MDINMNKIIRVGNVSSTNPTDMTVRVAFSDEDNLVSDDLKVLNHGSKSSKEYYMPAVNEQVVCIFLPNGRNTGFVIGSFFSQEDNLPSEASQDKRILEHNGDLEIKCSGQVNITGSTGDVIVNGISLVNHIHPESIGTVTGKPQ